MAKDRQQQGTAPADAGASSPPAPAATRTVRVRAVRLGFYGGARRRPGTQFDMVVRGEKLPTWVVEAKAGDSAPQAAAKQSPLALSELSRQIVPDKTDVVI